MAHRRMAQGDDDVKRVEAKWDRKKSKLLREAERIGEKAAFIDWNSGDWAEAGRLTYEEFMRGMDQNVWYHDAFIELADRQSRLFSNFFEDLGELTGTVLTYDSGTFFEQIDDVSPRLSRLYENTYRAFVNAGEDKVDDLASKAEERQARRR